MSLKGSILVVDDDAAVAGRLSAEFGTLGLTVRAVATLGQAREICRAHPVAGIVSENHLADGAVIGFCEWLRREGGDNRNRPVLVLAHQATETERVAALEAGADDVVAKPFNGREILLRLRRWLGADQHPALAPTVCRVGPGILDITARTLKVGSREVALTPKESQLLCALFKQRGTVCSREALLGAIWGLEEHLSVRAVDTLVRRLRRKLGSAGRAVHTVRGFGYRLADSR